MYRIAIDVGGTFTDVVAVNETGDVTFVKVTSTPEDQSLGVMTGLERLSAQLSLSLTELLPQTERIVHGMTVATNALLERKGARVGLLTTEGHRDVLEMREGLKPERYNLRLPRPEPLVPRHLRLGVRERLRADGRIETPLDLQSVEAAIRVLQRENVNAVAVCYLHAYRDDRHERETRRLLEAAMPDVYICLSSEVLPQIKEYRRVSTTAVNAYVGPLIKGYLQGLENRLQTAGFAGPLLVMLSHGGVAPVEEAVRIAASTVLSGPAGGVAGARRVAAMMGAPDLIPLDMGGTSTDISLIVDGEAHLSAERGIATEHIALPSLDIITLGAGGGSIGRVEEGGLLKVGPQSAGAMPGPACYGHGGISATVTDASVVLGYLDPDNFIGGAAQLDREAAHQVLRQIGEGLGIDELRAAEGVHRVVNTHMAEGIRLATVRRGVDPRRFTLLGFGGAAGLHVTELARLLSLRRVLVPRVASVLSAWGMLATELRLESIRSHVGETDVLDAAAVQAIYEELERHGIERMSHWFSGGIEVRRMAEMRYGEQIYEIDVSLDGIDFTTPDALARLKSAFEHRHEELYTYSLKEQHPVLVNARVTTVGVLPAPPREPLLQAGAPPLGTRERDIYLGQWIRVPVYSFTALAAGQEITGPAVVESDTTTVILRPGDHAVATPERWLDITIE
ncbi:hydantoinase/oxoprolinase family protein [Candidatus Entotheonella palauensis]|uniref:hydantoinase/oxoprolinase family protein n=1 Tax=Candidatus Entotheonella palauensis TaxID=93172 RepID=UPI000B7F459E|nr:hydantoinase/oxoprolinase family protein [Candidatus Entotheonella palauensis]